MVKNESAEDQPDQRVVGSNVKYFLCKSEKRHVYKKKKKKRVNSSIILISYANSNGAVIYELCCLTKMYCSSQANTSSLVCLLEFQ